MDKNTTTGLVLIGIILIGASFFFKPSVEEIKQLEVKEDSIKNARTMEAGSLQEVAPVETIAAEQASEKPVSVDTNTAEMIEKKFGPFSSAATGSDELLYIENDLVKIGISPKGGTPATVQLKKFLTSDKKDLFLVDSNNYKLHLNFYAGNAKINTSELYFAPQGAGFTVKDKETATLSLRAYTTTGAYLEYEYKLTGNSYLIDFNINAVGMDQVVPVNNNYFDLVWDMGLLQTEQNMKNERMNSKIFYKFKDDDVESLSENKNDEEDLNTSIRWISFKQHFFSTSLIAKESFDEGKVESVTPEKEDYIKEMRASLILPYNGSNVEKYPLHMYFGPNHFQTLKKLDLELETQIRLGWWVLGWINRFIVIPVFNFFGGFGWNYGIVILLLTVLLKIVLFPLTYKSYLSMAKMKVIKPEMEELKEKYGSDNTKLQQEYMSLYRKAGVNPIGGCLPMLLQMPILIAFFYFFPSSIELRQESFLWANDLSTYDSIWDFGVYPIIDKIYGDHVSLFTLLMTVSTIIYTRLNNQVSGATGQMKYIGYIMPIFFLGFFNNYSAGLTYYYFCANMITFGQQWMIRKFVDDDAIHRKIQAHKKKAGSGKKSKFQTRLEEMAKQRAAKAKKK